MPSAGTRVAAEVGSIDGFQLLRFLGTYLIDHAAQVCHDVEPVQGGKLMPCLFSDYL